jgi:hypothetical protein
VYSTFDKEYHLFRKFVWCVTLTRTGVKGEMINLLAQLCSKPQVDVVFLVWSFERCSTCLGYTKAMVGESISMCSIGRVTKGMDSDSCSDKKLFQCHFVHHRSPMDWPEINLGFRLGKE